MSETMRLDQAAFSYPQKWQGSQPISLTIESGQALLLTGPSGCGKSTIARLACGLIPHLYHGEMHGSAYLAGRPTNQTPLWELSELAGMVFQNPAAQMLTSSVEDEIVFGLENLGLPASEITTRVEDALNLFGLQDFRKRMPQTLSGGEQQKLALACTLARQTPFLVLDEPLSMLDSTAAIQFVECLQELCAKGHTLLICEHRQAYLSKLLNLHTLYLDEAGNSSQDVLLTKINPLSFTTPAIQPVETGFCLEINELQVKRGNYQALNGINLSLDSGQVVAILGRNGAGKTTLLRAMAGLQDYQGTVQILAAQDTERPQFSIVFQNPDLQLFNANVHDEILYRLPNPDLAYYDWLVEILDLTRYQHVPPLLLSEGEKRRVALAIALMRKSRHGLLLDEPSLGQDAQHKEVLWRTARAVADAGYLVIIATHDLELAAKADQLVLLTSQGVLEQGQPRALFANSSSWERMGIWLPEWIGSFYTGGFAL
jgi:energy-coupling factor transport system ATP-binding protein